MKKYLYKLLEILFYRKGKKAIISGFELVLPIQYNRYFEKDYELNNINFINNYVRAGMTVIDIGAHVGLLSVVLSQKVGDKGHVYSFEPTPSTFSVLQKVIDINGSTNVKIFQQAVSDKRGKTFFLH